MSRAGGRRRRGDGIRDHPVIDERKRLAFPGWMRLAEAMRIEVVEPGYRHYTLDVTAAGEA